MWFYVKQKKNDNLKYICTHTINCVCGYKKKKTTQTTSACNTYYKIKIY